MFGLSACHWRPRPEGGFALTRKTGRSGECASCLKPDRAMFEAQTGGRMRLGDVRPKKNSPDAQPQKYPCAGR